MSQSLGGAAVTELIGALQIRLNFETLHAPDRNSQINNVSRKRVRNDMNTMRLILRRSAVSIALLLVLLARAAAQDLTPKFDEYLSALVKQGRFTAIGPVGSGRKSYFQQGLRIRERRA